MGFRFCKRCESRNSHKQRREIDYSHRAFQENNNHYPDDISVLKPEYLKSIPSPWIMGISGYRYEKKDNHFNLTFSQNVLMGFNVEVVVYDPAENHKAEGELTTLYKTSDDRWKYYIYD